MENIQQCKICNGKYPESKHNFEYCYSLDYKWDLKQFKKLYSIKTENKCVQNHGFKFENEVRKIFKQPEEKNNTNKWDITKENNIFNSNENISIKMSGNSYICCSDILRFYDINFEEINTIIVGRYKQKGIIKTIYEIIEINYNEKLHKILFGNCNHIELVNYIKYIKTVNKSDSKEYLNKKKELQERYRMKIIINPKVDSRNQRRVQCSIPFKIFKTYSEFIITSSITIRNHKIKLNYKSPRRRFR
jgi:hypothetical protein